jgi:hypothetical protein
MENSQIKFALEIKFSYSYPVKHIQKLTFKMLSTEKKLTKQFSIKCIEMSLKDV